MKKLLSILLCAVLLISSVGAPLSVSAELNVDIDMEVGDLLDNNFPEDDNTPTQVFVMENENNVKGGYLVKNGNSYTAVCYKLSTFEGWFDKSGNLITTDITVTPEVTGKYYGAKFNTQNLINDSGFENYATNKKIYDHANKEKQIWTAHNSIKAEALTAFGSTYAKDTYKNSGTNSMSMNPPWQLVSTNVKLAPNTEYYVVINFAYTTKLPTTHLDGITYGLYDKDTEKNAMVSLGTGATKDITLGESVVPGTWYKNTFVFTTGDTVPDDAEFGYVFRVYNNEEGVTANEMNDTTLYVDDIMVIPAEKFEVSLNATNVATIEPTNGSAKGYVVKDEEYFFKVIAETGATPVVSVGEEVLTADENGIYSFVATGDSEIKIDCGAADEGRPQNGKDYYGRDLTKYNSEIYLEKIWEGDTVYHETALFVKGKNKVKLLYPVDEVISFRSYSLETTYIKGVDFDITDDGYIELLEGSRIPVYTGALTTNVKPGSNAFALRDDENTWLVAVGDTTHANLAVAITYKHSKTFADGYQPSAPVSQSQKLNNVLEKLQNGEEVNVVVMGDSISCGWSSSGINPSIEIFSEKNDGTLVNYNLNAAPYAPTFAQMIEAELKAKYPNATINFKNLSLGGKSSAWAASNIAARLALWKDENGNQVVPDLILTGFGVNDSAGKVSVANFKNSMKTLVENARAASGNADMEALYYSPFLPNQLTSTWDVNNILAYESALAELASEDPNAGVAKVTSVFAEIVKSKAPEDYISSYWNHGNDFTARIYATVILETMLSAPIEDDEIEFTPGNINGDENNDVDLQDVVALAQVVAGWEGVTHLKDALDVNGDGNVDLQDVVHLAQYTAGWDVKLSGAN